MTFKPDYYCHPGCAAQEALTEQLEARKADTDEIERLQGFVAKVRDAVENIDPDVLAPNATVAMVAVQDALTEMSVCEPKE